MSDDRPPGLAGAAPESAIESESTLHENLLRVVDRFSNIHKVADPLTETWHTLMLEAIRDMREVGQTMAKEIIIKEVLARRLSPHRAAILSGFSRQSIYNWIAADKTAHDQDRLHAATEAIALTKDSDD